MDLKEHLEEQVNHLRSEYDLAKASVGREKSLSEAIRQSNIDTIKWVMEMIESKKLPIEDEGYELENEDGSVYTGNQGYNEALDDIIQELNKAITK